MTMDDTGRVVSLPPEFEPPHHWWQNPRWLAALGFLIFVIGNATWALTSLATSQTVKAQQQPIDRIEAVVTGPLADANAKLDSLTAYVNTVQANANKNAATLTVALQEIDQLRALVCQSSDPIRRFVCALTPLPVAPVVAEPQTPATPTTTPPTTTAPQPPATTCPTLPNGKCRH